MRLEVSDALQGADFLALRLDVLFGFGQELLVSQLVQREHILQNHNFEPIASLLLIPRQHPPLILLRECLLNLIHPLRLPRLILLILLIELRPFYPHHKPRLNLPLIQHLQCNPNTLLLCVGDGGVAFGNAVVVAVDFDLLFAGLWVDPDHAGARGELF